MLASQTSATHARRDGASAFDGDVTSGTSLLSNRDFHQLYDKDTVSFSIQPGDSITFTVSPMGAAIGTLSQGSTTIDIPLGAALTMTFQTAGTLSVGVQFLDYVHRDGNGRTKASNAWRKPQPSEAGKPGAPTTRGGLAAKRVGGQSIQTELGAVPVMVTDSATPGAQVEKALEQMSYAQFGGEVRRAAPADVLDDVQFALDIIGVFDQTGFADVASGVIAVARGDWTAALLSLAATIPVLGAAAIIPKAAAYLTKKGFGKLAKAVTSNFSSIAGKCWGVLQGSISAVSAAIQRGAGVLDAVRGWFGRVADDLAAVLRREEDQLALANADGGVRKMTHGSDPWNPASSKSPYDPDNTPKQHSADDYADRPDAGPIAGTRRWGELKRSVDNAMMAGNKWSVDFYVDTAEEGLVLFQELVRQWNVQGNGLPENAVAWAENHYEARQEGYHHYDRGGGGHDTPHWQVHIPLGRRFLIVRIIPR